MEVVVVVLIVSLAAGAMATMAYRQSDSFRLQLAGREAYGFLRAARSFALLDERENPCLYDPESRRITEQARGKSMSLPDGVDVALEGRNEEGREGQAEPVILARFYPDGSSGGESVLLYAGRRELLLRINPVFGWVRLGPADQEGP